MNDVRESSENGVKTRRPSSYALGCVTALSLMISIIALNFARAAARNVEKMSSRIEITDPQGRPRIRLQARDDGASLELLDERGVARVALEQSDSDDFVLRMRGRDESHDAMPALELRVSSGFNYVAVRDKAGTSTRLDAGSLLAQSSRGSVRLASGSSTGPELSMSAGPQADPVGVFNLNVGARSTLSGVGEFSSLHKAFVQDLALQIRHANANEKQSP